ncbi:MAG: hypothetical protein ACOCP8_01060 [archaeon]
MDIKKFLIDGAAYLLGFGIGMSVIGISDYFISQDKIILIIGLLSIVLSLLFIIIKLILEDKNE